MRSISKIAFRVLLVFLVAVGVEKAVRFAYMGWNTLTGISVKERKELSGTIDTLYCGTSLTYMGFSPQILDEELGTNSFNLGRRASR